MFNFGLPLQNGNHFIKKYYVQSSFLEHLYVYYYKQNVILEIHFFQSCTILQSLFLNIFRIYIKLQRPVAKSIIPA